MTVNYTTLLGLAKPVSGTESGTWGDTVNNNLTDYLDDAIAGAQIISGTLTAVTLSKTTGANLSQAGTGSTGSSQYQIIRCTGAPASLLTITVPAANKTYVVINATSTSQSVKIVGAGPTTGVTILSGKTSIVAWNGSDFVEVTPNTISGVLPILNGGTGNTTGTATINANLTGAITSIGNAASLGSFTSANLAAALTDETGTGVAVFASNPTFPAQINLTANSGYNIYASGTADNYLAGGLTVGAVISTGIGVTTGETAIELGSNRTGDGVSYIDFHSTSGTDYETRIIRAAGTNGALQIINTGTGELQLQSANTASITFLTSATERMRIDSAGRIGINITPSAGRGLTIAGSGLITGAVNGFSVLSAPVVAADVTGDYNIFRGTTTTAASAFTLANAINFVAAQGVIGAGSSITSQYGFQANETLIGATSNNWGFVGNIPAGTGRYNLYMAGTADNYLAGNLGIGTTGYGGRFSVVPSTTPTTVAGANQIQIGESSGNSAYRMQLGYFNNGASGYNGAIQVYDNGNPQNLILNGVGGNVGIGTASPDASAILDVQSTTKGVRMPNMTTTQKNAIASPAAGLMVFDTNLAKLCVYTGAAWQTITSI